ncbi:MAG: diacylglycerol kinase family protein [Ilumatobacter sp.]|uniref:diacylglycerol/lipid kinase family protein n=2 Tax=Ilumatobacter sp. TaxID=1967498 RepID=UPI0032989D1D
MLIVNSFASSVTARNTVVVQRRLSEGADDPDHRTRRSPDRHQVEVVETNRRGHATRFAHDAARRGVDVVIGYGGDGTLNEVATGIAGTDTALGVLPGGSTNVFARTLGMPNDPVEAVEHLVRGIDAADFRPIGLGQVNGRSFCFHTGIGYDAAVVQRVEKHGSLKRWLGHPLFIYAGLSTWATGYDRKHPHFAVSGDGGADLENGYFTIVLNTNPYTYLGNRPLDLSPHAGLDQALVAITFTTMSARAILTSLAGALKGGGVRPAPHLDIRTDVRRLTVTHHDPFPYQLDGDALGETNRLDFVHVPDAVRLVFPNSG